MCLYYFPALIVVYKPGFELNIRVLNCICTTQYEVRSLFGPQQLRILTSVHHLYRISCLSFNFNFTVILNFDLLTSKSLFMLQRSHHGRIIIQQTSAQKATFKATNNCEPDNIMSLLSNSACHKAVWVVLLRHRRNTY